MQASPSSLRVLSGTGGLKPLTDADKATIDQRIEDLLPDTPITYRAGALTLNGVTRPLPFTWDGREGRAEIKQTDFAIKPFSALFGALKVADVVEVRVRLR